MLNKDVLIYLLSFCNNTNLLMLKLVSKTFYQLILNYNPHSYLFHNLVDFWCNILMENNNLTIISFYKHQLDESFLIAFGYLTGQHLINVNLAITHLKYDEKLLKSEHLVKVIIDNHLNFRVDLIRLLKLLNTYDDTTISKCLSSLPLQFKNTTKPHSDIQDIIGFADFMYNPEEFFWAPKYFIHESWFAKKYKHIHNCLLK